MNERLIEEAAGGSKEAFVKLYGEYKDKLYRYALYRLGDPDDAEDAVSECVLEAWKNIGNLRVSRAFGTWIFRILAGCCAARIKTAISTRENLERVYSEAPAGISGRTDPGSVPALLTAELTEALDLLKNDEREVVLLSVIGGFSSSEIASQTGLSPGGVRSKLSRSLAKMRAFLQTGDGIS